MPNYKFNGTKLITAGIQSELPTELINHLWCLLERRKLNKTEPLDYLQVFEIRVEDRQDDRNLTIVHSQEVPPYKGESRFKAEFDTNCKIFLIDDIECCTMLFSNEY